jgi:hypothetical protein
MEHLARSGVRSIVANTHPHAERVEFVLDAARPPGVKLCFSREEVLLGTGGGLRKAHALFDDSQAPVVVMNGDTLFAPDLRHARAEHLARGAVATMILRRTPNPERFGSIGVDEQGWVAFSAMPESGCVIRSAYRSWVDSGAPVLGIIDELGRAFPGHTTEHSRGRCGGPGRRHAGSMRRLARDDGDALGNPRGDHAGAPNRAQLRPITLVSTTVMLSGPPASLALSISLFAAV